MTYNFEWDPQKNLKNRNKHGISFETAATIFRDPLAITIFDNDHSENEDRWITLGMTDNNHVLVVHHTFYDSNMDSVVIRIISSRIATSSEKKQYEEL